MTFDRYQELKALVSDALDLPQNQREEYVQLQASDESIKEEALELLALESQGETPFTNAVEQQLANTAQDLLGPDAHLPRIPNYEIKETLGSGGMGIVYRAEQTGALNREVALKLIRPGWDSERVSARFDSERRALSRMEHRNIARVFEAGTTSDNLPWFAMELVTGQPINRWCEQHKATLDQRLDLFAGVCRGVQHAHQKGIIHRDLKPSNILVAESDSGPLAKIIDFGIAKALGDPLTENPLVTLEGQLVGTPEYMSPERLEGRDDDVDIRSDVYSLGVLLYQLLCGTLPFDRASMRRTGTRQTQFETDAPRPSTRVSKITDATTNRVLKRQLEGDLDWITLKALAPESDGRYATVQGLLEDIERFRAGQPVLAGPPTARYRISKFIKRNRMALAIVAMIIVLLTGGLFESNRQRLKATAALAEAESVTNFLTEMLASVRADELGKDVTVREALDQAALTLSQDLAGRELLQARLLTTIGRTYAALSEFESGERHLNEALAIRLPRLGERSPETLSTQYHLAFVYLRQGRVDEAIDLFNHVLVIRREVLGDLHSSTLGTVASLGNAYQQKGNYELAVASAREAYDGFLATKGPEDEDTLNGNESLGSLYTQLGDFERAGPHLEKAASVRLAKFGLEHPASLSAISNLAFLRYDQGDLAACDSLFTVVLVTRRKILGPEHLEVMAGTVNLASLRSGRGELEPSAALLEELLPRAEASLGDEHQITLACLNNLAWIYSELERYDEAEVLFDKTMAVRLRVLGADHIDAMTTLNNLGLIYGHTGRLTLAEATHRDLLARRKKVLGANHPHAMYSMVNLALTLELQGRQPEAEKLFREAYQMQVEKLGADHPDTRTTADKLAEMYDSLQRVDDAVHWRALGSTE